MSAPLAIVGPRCTHAVEVYDFYKPRGDTEYATVDGKLSQSAYLPAVDECWSGLKSKLDLCAGELGLVVAAVVVVETSPYYQTVGFDDDASTGLGALVIASG